MKLLVDLADDVSKRERRSESCANNDLIVRVTNDKVKWKLDPVWVGAAGSGHGAMGRAMERP